VKPSAITLTVDIDGKSHSYSVVEKLLKTIDGRMYLSLSRRESCTRRLMALRVAARSTVDSSHDDSHRALSKSDALDQLSKARDLVIGRFLCGEDKMFDAQMRRLKKTQRKLSQLPDAIQVTTPSILDVAPVTIWMLSDVVGRKGAVAPSVELTDTAINWVMDVIKAQVDAGDTMSAKVAKRARPNEFDVVEGEPECDEEHMAVIDEGITDETSVVVYASDDAGMVDIAEDCEGGKAGLTVEQYGDGVHGAVAGA
jgi:hypothetical protein